MAQPPEAEAPALFCAALLIGLSIQCLQIMPGKINTTLWGPLEDRPAETDFVTLPRSVAYNKGYLHSSTPRYKQPLPKPFKHRSVHNPTYQAATDFPPAIRPSAYNKGYLKSSGPRVKYPLGDGPMTEEKAIERLETADGMAPVPS